MQGKRLLPWLLATLLLSTGQSFYYAAQAQSASTAPGGYNSSQKPDFSVASPTVASLGKFGLTPVAYYTGIPQISIPLWEVKGKKLRLPISLNYNNNGLKVTEEASWIGLGWSLQAGGMITQQVQGNGDDLQDAGTCCYGSSGILPYEPFSPATGTPQQTQQKMNLVANGKQDSSPDIFVYNFGTHSGRFVLYNGTAHQFLYDGLQITYDYPNHRFTIVDGEGTVYQFFKREVSYNDNVTGNSYSTSSSWLLTAIISADGGDTLTLTYSSTPEAYMTPTGYTVDDSYEGYPVGSLTTTANQNTPCAAHDYVAPHERQSLSRSSTIAYRLERIESQTERIEFVPQAAPRLDVNSNLVFQLAPVYTSAYALASIRVFDKSQPTTAPLRTFNLYSSYFTWHNSTGVATPTNGRLKLDSLQELGASGIAKPPYTFTYQDGYLPDRTTRNIDHWGFYNYDEYKSGYAGLNGNASLVPATPNYVLGTSYRKPTFAAALLTTLQQITYPTGGSETFLYEQNLYKPAPDSTERAGPGLRVKQIVAQAASGSLTYRTFTYTAPVDQWLVPRYEKTLFNNPGGSEFDCLLVTVSGRVPNVFSMFSSVVQYTQVFEAEGLNGEGGQTEYQFEQLGDRANGLQQVKKITRTAGGQTLREEENHYDASEDLSLPVFVDPTATHGPNTYGGCFNGIAVGGVSSSPELNNVYGTWENFEGCYLPGIDCTCNTQIYPKIAHKVDDDYGFVVTPYLSTFLNVSALWNRLAWQKTRMYDATNSQLYSEVTTTYYYDQSPPSSTGSFVHRYVTRQETTDSQGATRIVRSRYPQDYALNSGPGSDSYYNALQQLVTQHQVASPVEQISLVKTGTATLATGGQLTLFKSFGSAQNVQPASQLVLETSSPLPDGIFSGINYNTLHWDAHFIPRLTYRYDGQGNLLEWRKNQQLAACLRHSTSAQPIAEAQNAHWAQLASTSFEPNATGRWVYDSLGAHTIPTHFTGAYAYQLDGTATAAVRRSALAAGDYELLFWCHGLNVPLVTGATQQQHAQTAVAGDWHQYRFQLTLPANATLQLNSAPSQLIWLDELRLQPVGALMTSYTHDPLIGLTAQTGPDGRTTFFEYDRLGRLLRTRDEQHRILSQQQYHYAGSK